MHDNMELPEDDRYVVSFADEGRPNVYTSSLTIRDARPQDAGTYRTTATNDLGQESVTCSLIVNSM